MAADRAERRLTASFAALFDRGDPRVVAGIGDDAAVLARPAGRLVACCDPVVAGVHFAADAPAAAIGAKAIARNVSDLAAMGATPRFALASVLVPRDFGRRRLGALMRGLRRAADAADLSVVGGDLGSTPGPLTVTVTALGELRGRALPRGGLGVGDALHVTGPLGGSILGRHLRIAPRVAAGRALARDPAVSACMDVSDGLVLDLWTMLQASGCPGAELDAAAIPVHRDARRLAARDGTEPLQHALHDGEDHELLFGVAAGRRLARAAALDAVARLPIGRVVARPGIWLLAGGRRRRLAVQGYQHDLG